MCAVLCRRSTCFIRLCTAVISRNFNSAALKVISKGASYLSCSDKSYFLNVITYFRQVMF